MSHSQQTTQQVQPGAVFRGKAYGLYLQYAETQCDEHLMQLTKMEDAYIEAGLTYHSTNVDMRTPEKNDAFPPNVLHQLKEAFLVATPQEHEWAMGKFTKQVELVNKARSHCKRLGPTDVLLRRCQTVCLLMKEATDLKQRCERHLQQLQQWSSDLCTSEVQYSGPEYLLWPDRRPIVIGAEWEPYRDWVHSLPETRRCLERCNVDLHDIAMRMLTEPRNHCAENKGERIPVLRVRNPDPMESNPEFWENFLAQQDEVYMQEAREADAYEEPVTPGLVDEDGDDGYDSPA